MVQELPPFIKHKSLATYTRRTSPVLTSYSRKLRTKIALPEILITGNVWRGSSEIVKKFTFTSTLGLSLVDIIPSSNANYVICVSWKPTSDTIVRYKLWENVGEILYVPLYSGQAIGADYFLEVWNTPDATLHGGGDIIYTSLLSEPSCLCCDDDITITLDTRDCTDLIFNFSGFDPAIGDYYLVLGDCGATQLISGSVQTKLTLQADDTTWHDFTLVKLPDGAGGFYIYYSVDQNPTSPGVKPYFAFLFSSLVYPLSLTLQPDGMGGFIYTTIIGASIIDASALPAVGLLADDGNHYSTSIMDTGGGLLAIQVGQTPI